MQEFEVAWLTVHVRLQSKGHESPIYHRGNSDTKAANRLVWRVMCPTRVRAISCWQEAYVCLGVSAEIYASAGRENLFQTRW
jgi:hypothetical protein